MAASRASAPREVRWATWWRFRSRQERSMSFSSGGVLREPLDGEPGARGERPPRRPAGADRAVVEHEDHRPTRPGAGPYSRPSRRSRFTRSPDRSVPPVVTISPRPGRGAACRAPPRAVGDRGRAGRAEDPPARGAGRSAQQDPRAGAAGVPGPAAGPLRHPRPEARGGTPRRRGPGPALVPARGAGDPAQAALARSPPPSGEGRPARGGAGRDPGGARGERPRATRGQAQDERLEAAAARPTVRVGLNAAIRIVK